MSSKQRVEYIDVYRGIAILLMILGHVYIGKTFDHYIHAFHMPMWFFVSGYFFKDKGYKYFEYIKIRGKRLLVPYAFFGTIYYLVAVKCVDSSCGLVHKAYIERYLFKNYNGLPISGVFWFLTCILIADLLFLFIKRHIKSELLFTMSILLLTVFGVLYTKFCPRRMIWSADTSLVALGFYYAGFLLRNNQRINKWYQDYLENGKVFNIFLFIINAILILMSPYINMRLAIYPISVVFYFNALVAIVVYLSFSYAISKINVPIIRCGKKYLCYIGENTIGYLCLNQLVIWILKKFIPSSTLLEQLVLFVFCMIILTIITQIFLHTPLKVVIGK